MSEIEIDSKLSTSSPKSIDEIRSTFFHYLNSNFVNRDLQSTIELFSPDISGIGTGVDEIAYGIDDFKKLYERDIAEAPDPVFYTVDKLEIRLFHDQLGVVQCELNIETQILQQMIRFNHLRLSLVFIHSAGRWLIHHMHISFPTLLHGEDESYPMKELEDQNILLQKLVDEKTRHLNDALQVISQIATTDKLTGLFNRTKIDEVVDREIQRSQRYKNPLTVILIDIDFFKFVNDHHGHLIGDQVLVEFANLLMHKIRRTDYLARWGGEEFLLICPEIDIVGAETIAETLRLLISEQNFKGIGQITASFGVTTFRDGDTRNTLLSRVDKALYDSKRSGRNRIKVS